MTLTSRFCLPTALALFSALGCSPQARLAETTAAGTVVAPAAVGAGSIGQWIHDESAIAAADLRANIAPEGAARGAVVASPSRTNPDYFRHWVRDAALTMDVVAAMVDDRGGAAEAPADLGRLADYAAFSRQNQLTPNDSGGPMDLGLGEPLFEVDGSPFHHAWGRPQDDGPALRARALTHYARILLSNGQDDYVRTHLYDGRLPTASVIKADLEFVAHHWTDPCFDLWEEVLGDHFYTRAVQRRALLDGAALARDLGDPGAAAFYEAQAAEIGKALDQHWDGGRGFIVATLARRSGVEKSGLDVAVILEALHAAGAGDPFGPTDGRILATASHLRQVFQALYPINARTADAHGEPMAPAIGRYPEDQYSGTSTPGPGNAWVLATAAMAELHLRAAATWERQGKVSVTDLNLKFLKDAASTVDLTSGDVLDAADPRFGPVLAGLRARADAYFRRLREHASADGALAEQIERDSGDMHGARNLTWSFASFLTAAWQLCSAERSCPMPRR